MKPWTTLDCALTFSRFYVIDINIMQEPRAKSQEPRAKSQEPRAKSQEPRYFLKRLKSLIKYFFYYHLNSEIRDNPEIITIIDGGLGSQMSQFVLGQEIERITGIRVSYDVTSYDHGSKDLLGENNRLYELEKIFPVINVRKAKSNKVHLYRRFFNKQNGGILLQNLDEIDLSKPPIYLGGYWTTEKYSNYDMDYLRKIFSFNLKLNSENQKIYNEIYKNNCSVALQIRLGDYIKSMLNVITPEYFFRAIELLSKKIYPEQPHFFVFSNDINKSREILRNLPCHFTFVNSNDNDHGAYDMYLMSQCHHFIISNSTFGYWPAMLSIRSPKKRVIEPGKWLITDKFSRKSKYDWWIYLDS